MSRIRWSRSSTSQASGSLPLLCPVFWYRPYFWKITLLAFSARKFWSTIVCRIKQYRPISKIWANELCIHRSLYPEPAPSLPEHHTCQSFTLKPLPRPRYPPCCAISTFHKRVSCGMHLSYTCSMRGCHVVSLASTLPAIVTDRSPRKP